MHRKTIRLALGLVAVMLVTGLLAGAVVTSAAMTHEMTDGDSCETGSTADVEGTPTPDDVASMAEDVTTCIAREERPSGEK